MRRNSQYAVAGFVGLIAIGLGIAATGGRFDKPAIDPDDSAQVAAGRQVYADHFARCHGANLEGEGNWRERKPNGRLPAPPHDASGHTWHHPDHQLFTIVKGGLSAVVPGYQSDMPAFEHTLSEPQINAVLTYIKSTWPVEIRERQETLNRTE